MALTRFRYATPFVLLFFLGAFLLFRVAGRTGGAPEKGLDGELRILSLSPNTTEILFALGLGDRVVGVSDFCRYPPEAAAKPKVGGLLNPNLERMIALEPNLVVLLPAHGDLGDKLAARGIRALIVPNDTVEDVFGSIEAIGAATGKEGAAAALVDSIRAVMDDVCANPPDRRYETMIVVSRAGASVEDVFVAGSGTYLDELLRRAGGRNVFGESLARYPEPSVEEILHKNPEVILEIRPEGKSDETETRLARAAWGRLPGLRAAQTGNVFALTGDYLVVPGPRMGRTLRDLAAVLHEVH